MVPKGDDLTAAAVAADGYVDPVWIHAQHLSPASLRERNRPSIERGRTRAVGSIEL